jgi:hypothetical protein
VDKLGNEIVSEVKPDDDWEEEWEKMLADPEFWTFVEFCYSVRFYINLLFVALPWWVFSATLEIGLIVVNILFNKGFAQGNVYLMYNTLVGAF